MPSESLYMIYLSFVLIHIRSATAVLAAVKTGLSKYATTKVTVVGHSLGTLLFHPLSPVI